MINSLLNGLFNLVIGLVGVLLSPIDSLINSTIPQFSDVLNLFGDFIDYIATFVPWGLSWFNLPSFLLTFVLTYIIAKIGISAAVHVIKLALAWWRTIIP